MENVLEVYQRPEDSANPLVCVDEKSQQHIKETRSPIPMTPACQPDTIITTPVMMLAIYL